MMPFSVLLPVYFGDQPDFFERALRSVGADQTLQADEILAVCDGPVRPGVDILLAECEAGNRNDILGTATLTVHRLPRNQGLSAALNQGLLVARNEVIARADADDIATPERFAIQIPLMEKYDLVGGAIAEFSEDENETGMVRSMPQTAEEIRAVVTYRDPFNHPTVVYKRTAVLDAGGYEHVNLMEDYWLFARMVHQGVSCMNVPDMVVKYRIGAGAYARRGGTTLLKSEWELQRRLYSAGITTRAHYLRNLAVRGGYRLIPAHLRKALYQTAGKRLWFRPGRASGEGCE